MSETPPTDVQRAAYAAGRAAFAEGLPLTACPHRHGEDDPEGLRTLWVRGYSDAGERAGAPVPRRPFRLGGEDEA